MESISGKVLVVDDDKSIRVTISQALESAGFTVVTAVDGQHALDKLAEETDYDVVLLDMKMPGLDGMEVLRKIKEMKPLMPVIMVTGYGTVETAVEAMKLGAVDFIQKPFSPEEIRSIVKRVVERKKLEEGGLYSFEHFVEYAKKAAVQRDLDKAMEHLKNALRVDPTKPEPFYLMGVILEVQGKVDMAQRMYRAALVMDPSYRPALDNLNRTVEYARRRERPDLDSLVQHTDKAEATAETKPVV